MAAVVLRAVDSLTAAATERSSGMAAAVLVLATSVNQDGRSSSLTAPNGVSQQALIRSALTLASLPPPRVNLLSMHGTGEWVIMRPGAPSFQLLGQLKPWPCWHSSCWDTAAFWPCAWLVAIHSYCVGCRDLFGRPH